MHFGEGYYSHDRPSIVKSIGDVTRPMLAQIRPSALQVVWLRNMPTTPVRIDKGTKIGESTNILSNPKMKDAI